MRLTRGPGGLRRGVVGDGADRADRADRADGAAEFDRALRAAAIFDEDPVVTGRLMRGPGPVALEIPLPVAAG